MTTPDNNALRLAREWAERIASLSDHPLHSGAKAAAEVIASLPDEIVDGAKVRELIDAYEIARDGNAKETDAYFINRFVVNNLRDLLPTPPTMSEQAWDDAEHHLAEAEWSDGRKVIMLHLAGDERSILCLSEGNLMKLGGAWLTPTGKRYTLTPDDDGMETEQEAWMDSQLHGTPSEQAAAKDVCIRPEDVPAGEAWLVSVDGDRAIGYRNAPEGASPWIVTYQGRDDVDRLSDKYVTLVSLLVPERARKTLTSLGDYEDAEISTIVKVRGQITSTWIKDTQDTWKSFTGTTRNNFDMYGTAREVLWEPEEQA